jgi:hypothetical protein
MQSPGRRSRRLSIVEALALRTRKGRYHEQIRGHKVCVLLSSHLCGVPSEHGDPSATKLQFAPLLPS